MPVQSLGGASVMVWARISFNHKSPLVVINGNITARRYINGVLDPVMVPFLNTNPDITVFQQDNARPHTAHITRQYMQQENVEVLLWPSYSPDVSRIEHLWDQLGHHLANRNPKPGNRQQLVAALQEEWANIPQDSIRRLIRSMRRCCTSYVQAHGPAHGGHIPYWQLCDFHIWHQSQKYGRKYGLKNYSNAKIKIKRPWKCASHKNAKLNGREV